MLTHIVLVKFIAEATPEQKKLWRDEIIKLGDALTEVTATSAGEKVVMKGAEGLDCGWEDGAVITMNDMTAYQAYVVSTAHADYKKATDHLIAEKLIYDIVS